MQLLSYVNFSGHELWKGNLERKRVYEQYDHMNINFGLAQNCVQITTPKS